MMTGRCATTALFLALILSAALPSSALVDLERSLPTSLTAIHSTTTVLKSKFSDPSNLPQLALLGTSSIALAGVFASIVPRDFDSYLKEVYTTAPQSMALFGVSDMLAQKFEQRDVIDCRRVLSAVLIGLFLNSFGWVYWLYYLEFLVPSNAVGFDSIEGVASLSAKAFLDAAVWDTVGNTLGIILRRMMAGDSVGEAIAAWESAIVGVTILEFKFWPIWQSINFLWVPPGQRVLFCAVGSFLWNGYLSFIGGKKQGPPTPRGY